MILNQMLRVTAIARSHRLGAMRVLRVRKCGSGRDRDVIVITEGDGAVARVDRGVPGLLT
jgi:hypothetical protein